MTALALISTVELVSTVSYAANYICSSAGDYKMEASWMSLSQPVPLTTRPTQQTRSVMRYPSDNVITLEIVYL